MITRQASKAATIGPDLTALIDIIFIVVVFLLLTANTQVLPLPIDISESENLGKSSPDLQAITVSIHSRHPIWAIGSERFDSWEEFKLALISRLGGNSTIAIAAEKNATVAPLMKLLALLQERNIPTTQLLMENTAS